MCNLGEGIYERAIVEEQARQAIETEKLLKKIENENKAEREALDKKRIQELIAAGFDPDTVKRIMKS